MIWTTVAVFTIASIGVWLAAVAAWSLAMYAAHNIYDEAFNDADTDSDSDAAA